VSGDRVVLEGGGLERLGAALGGLTASGAEFVLVGGLAVLLRVAGTHRATDDVDTTASAPALIACVGEVPREGNRLWLDGVRVDVIDLDGFLDADPAEVEAATDDLHDRVFLVAHLWAHQSATALRSRIGGHDLDVAVGAVDALVGGKVSARLAGSRRDAAKHTSDAADLHRLLRLPVPERPRPAAVVRTLIDGLVAVLEDAERLARDASRFDPAGRPVTAEEFEVLASDWIDRLG